MMAVISYALGKNAEGDKNLATYEKAITPEAFTYFYIADRMRAVKRYEKAASLYERALQFPNPPGFLFYNLGVTYALMGNTDKAFQNLSKAVAMGFGTKESYEENEDLKSLRSDKRWNELAGGM
jgi:tetratricopeptide (TPR) repeat protein